MAAILKVEYLIESDEMNDEEYENQEFRTFEITQEMLIDIMEQRIELKKDECIYNDNFFVTKI